MQLQRRPEIVATADGTGVVSHAGSRLLADLADQTTLTGELPLALAELHKPGARHDQGRVLVDVAVAVAASPSDGRSLRRKADITTTLPNTVWADAIDTDGRHRDEAAPAETTHVLPIRTLSGYPAGTRVVRRERPHPGASLMPSKSATAGATPPTPRTLTEGNSPT